MYRLHPKCIHLCQWLELENDVNSCFISYRNEISIVFFCIVIYVADKHSPFIAKGKYSSAQSVKSFLLNQNLIHSIKSFHLYTVTYYTHLVCLHNVFSRASVPARALPVNSLHFNPPPRYTVIRVYQICCSGPGTWD